MRDRFILERYAELLPVTRQTPRLTLGEVAQNALANRVGVTFGERLVAVEAAHLGLPVL